MTTPSLTQADPNLNQIAQLASTDTTSSTTAAKGGQPITLGTAVILCVITAVMTLMLEFYAPAIAVKTGITRPGASTGSKVVYLDFEQLMAAGVKRAMTSAAGVTDVQSQADKFQADIGAAIKAYADAGYVVINSKALISATKSQDITGDVLSTLGLK